MTTHLINWSGAIVLALLLGTAYHLDGPTELQAAMDSAQAAADAAHEEQARERFSKSAQAACGSNAYFQILDQRTVQCFTKRGHRTHKVSL